MTEIVECALRRNPAADAEELAAQSIQESAGTTISPFSSTEGRLPDGRPQGKEMPPNNLCKPIAKFTDFIRFTLNKMRRLFSGSS